MDNKDAIRVGEELLQKEKVDNSLGKLLALTGKPEWLQRRIDGLTHLISLAKDYEQARSGLPEEKKCEHPCEVCQLTECAYWESIQSHNACLHQVALNLVKFKTRLPEIIRGAGQGNFFAEETTIERISQAITEELDGSK